MSNWTSAFLRLAALTVATTLALTGCGDADAGGQGIKVVATTTVLGDVVRQITGDATTVDVLVPIGADPHDYRPSAKDVAALQQADLVVAVGLGIEEGLEDVLEAASTDGVRVLEIAPLVDPLPFSDDAGLDPHVWLDPVRMAEAARHIGAALADLDASADWATRAEEYAGELLAAHERIEGLLASVPPERRKLVTNHDALGYFAARYGFAVLGTVIPGGSTLGDPSSAELARLAEVIRSEGVSAIFAETTEPATLAEALAEAVGGHVQVVELYTGSLGEPGSGADTLIGMLETNARRIAEALA